MIEGVRPLPTFDLPAWDCGDDGYSCAPRPQTVSVVNEREPREIREPCRRALADFLPSSILVLPQIFNGDWVLRARIGKRNNGVGQTRAPCDPMTRTGSADRFGFIGWCGADFASHTMASDGVAVGVTEDLTELRGPLDIVCWCAEMGSNRGGSRRITLKLLPVQPKLKLSGIHTAIVVGRRF